jgi:UDP-glucose 4-epimerase
MKVAITGPSGWVAKAFIASLKAGHFEVVTLSRADLIDQNALATRLIGVEVVVHLAALVHQMTGQPTLQQYREVNRDLTLSLAKVSARAGVKHLIFVSTAKVLGEASMAPLREDAPLKPQDAYAISKAEAETELNSLQKTNELQRMKVSIIRPPLIFGDGVKANYAKLEKWAASPWPLPLGSATAKRSMLSLNDLMVMLTSLILQGRQADQLDDLNIFNAASQPDQSAAEIISQLRAKQHRNAGLIPVPAFVMKAALTLMGQSKVYDRLYTTLQLDASKMHAFMRNSSQATGDTNHP